MWRYGSVLESPGSSMCMCGKTSSRNRTHSFAHKKSLNEAESEAVGTPAEQESVTTAYSIVKRSLQRKQQRVGRQEKLKDGSMSVGG